MVAARIGCITLLALAACGGGDRQPASDTAVVTPSSVASQPSTPTGEQLFQQRCITCHQATGLGLAGTYPPLAGSEFATAANVAVPISVVLHGIQGPLTVKGQRFDGLMPPYGLGVEMTDAEVAAVLTYVRSSWGNGVSAVMAEDVARVRAMPRRATGAVTESELKAMMR